MEPKGFDELKANPKNPRQISDFDFKNLVQSIKEFGDLSCVVYNITTGQLVGGHQRVEAFRTIEGPKKIVYSYRQYNAPDRVGTVAAGHVIVGDSNFPYREVKWDADRETAANIAANRIQGNWDLDLLAQVNYELSQESPDLLALTGQTDQEVTRLLDSVGLGEGTLDPEDEAPPLEDAQPAVSLPGEIYQLGPHRLMCGDATLETDVARLMAGTTADMVFTDPPYNIAYEGGGANKREGIMNDKMSHEDFAMFLQATCANLHKFCRGAEYICMSSVELDTLKTAFQQTGGHFQSFIIWVKNAFTLSGSDYQHKYEPILYGWPEGIINHYYVGYRDKSNVWEDINEAGATFDGETTSIKFGGYEVRIQGQVAGEVHRKKSKTDTWEFDKPTKSEDHPTMKPLALCEEAITNSSLRGGLVLDLFGGSGSTLIAADRQGRVCNMMELDPKYCDVIRKRYAKHVGEENSWLETTPVIEKLEEPAPDVG